MFSCALLRCLDGARIYIRGRVGCALFATKSVELQGFFRDLRVGTNICAGEMRDNAQLNDDIQLPLLRGRLSICTSTVVGPPI